MSDRVEAQRITVVYEFTDQGEMDKKAAELRDLFDRPKGSPARVTALSKSDEMTIYEILEFACQIDDAGFTSEVLDRKIFPPYFR